MPHASMLVPGKRTERFGRISRGPLEAVCAALLLLGALLRVWHYGEPSGFTFDEHHFVENARNYLAHKADWNDHPPLGKLTEALAIRCFGDHAWAWRLPSLLAGYASVLLGGWITRRLFDSRRAGLIAAALLAGDGFFIAYSRSAVLDGQLVALSLLCLALVLGTPTVLRYALAGLVAGCAASIKTSGVVLFLPLAVAAFWARPRQAYLMLLVAVCGFAAAFLGSWCVGLALMGKDPSPWFGLTETVRLMKQHAGATSMDNAFTSSWPTWFLPRRPLVLTSSTLGDDVRIATSMGNPLVWWATTLGSWGSVALLGWVGLVCGRWPSAPRLRLVRLQRCGRFTVARWSRPRAPSTWFRTCSNRPHCAKPSNEGDRASWPCAAPSSASPVAPLAFALRAADLSTCRATCGSPTSSPVLGPERSVGTHVLPPRPARRSMASLKRSGF